MAKLVSLRPRRVFSEELKRSIVRDIEEGRLRPTLAARQLFTSLSSIYRWLNQYSRILQSEKPMLITMQTQTHLLQAKDQRIAELERLVGQKQIQVEFLEKLLELASKELQLDVKKTFGTRPLNTFTDKAGWQKR